MEQYKISQLLNESTVLGYVTEKSIKVNNLSSGQNSVNKGTIIVEGIDDNEKRDKSYTLRIMGHLDHTYQKWKTHL